MSLIDTLKWRYACKKFDPLKKVSDQHIDFIKESIRLSASSYGMQAFKVLVIQDQELKEKLKIASWNQTQIADCSHLFVFCHQTSITKETVDKYADLRSRVQKKSMEETLKYVNYMWGSVQKYTPEFINQWSSRQTYIALSNLLTACGELKVDSCPIEGFEKEKYNEILGLTERGLAASVVAAVGYRAEDEPNQHNVKVRKATEDLFENIV